MSNFFGMSPNNNSGLNIGYAGQNGGNIAIQTAKAILFVFRPYDRQFGDVAVRPFQYQFDGNFQKLTEQITDTSKNGAASQSQLMEEFQRQTNFSDYMIAAPNPSMQFMSSRLSDKYRFILILTDTAPGFSGMAMASASNQMRRIYTGYFEDEPFNPLTLTASRRSLNPHAVMIFTHKTVVGTMTEMGAFGSRTMVNTRTSEEIISSVVAQNYMGRDTTNQDQRIHLMTPENCINSVEVDSSGYAMAVEGMGDITADQGQHVVSDILEQPTHNVATIVRGMMKYKDDITTKGRGMTQKIDVHYENDIAEDMSHRANLGRWMTPIVSRPMSQFDLDLNSRYSAMDIDSMVGGNLDVQDFDLERPAYYDTADQLQLSLNNQFSAMLSSIIGPVLNNFGLNSMSFSYEIMKSQGQVMEQFNTFAAESTWNIPSQELIYTAKAVEIELTKGVLRTIFSSMGDFRVEVAANATGMTVVRLDLIEQGSRSHADWEVPTCLGGLISPLMGTTVNQAHNSQEIMGLYGTVAGLQSGVEGFNANDHDFMNMATDTFARLDNGAMPSILND